MKTKNSTSALAAGLMALFCVGAAIFQLVLSLQMGGVSPQVVLFSILALIFAALWYSLRRPAPGQ